MNTKEKLLELIHKFDKEFIRFCIVGAFATGMHYGIYITLLFVFSIETEIWTNVIYSIGYAIGFVCNLYLSAHFTFKTDVTIKKGIGFVVTNVINYILHILFLNIFLWLNIPKEWAPIPSFCCVVPINFILVRIVFKKIKG